MLNVKNTMLDGLLEAIAPHLCCSCGGSGGLLCDNCKSYIKAVPLGACWVCERPTRGRLCHECSQVIYEIYIVGEREGALQRLIGLLKFQYTFAAARVLAGLLTPLLPSDAIIVPIPTQAGHIRVRGYDHLRLIVDRLRRPVAPLLVTKSSHTQHHLGRQARQSAAKSAFSVKGEVNPAHHYVVVDDIITTGATILAAVRCLRQAGASRVSVAVIARQPSTFASVSVKMAKVYMER